MAKKQKHPYLISPAWLHCNDAAELLSITPAQLRQEVYLGRIPEDARRKVAGHSYYHRAWVIRRKKFLEKNPQLRRISG